MNHITLFLLTLLTSISFANAQDSTLKRTPYKLKVFVDNKNFYEEELTARPYVFPNNSMQIYPGETIYVEVEQENGVIKNMKAVKENMNPSKTIVISFSQTVKKNVHEMTMLKIDNPFTQKLTYKATIFLLNQNKWVKTDVYPVSPKLSGIETWPDIITSIGLGNWSFSNP